MSASRFFGGSIAFYILKLLEKGELTPPLKIIEIGANKGHLLGDVAQFLDVLTENLLESCEFATIEPLANIAHSQKAYFQHLKLTQKTNFRVYNPDIYTSYPQNPSDKKSDAIVISNELLDSFPCEVIQNNQMLYIESANQKWQGVWRDIPASLQARVQSYQQLHKDTYQDSSFVSPSLILPSWEGFIAHLKNLATQHTTMYFLSFDYGGLQLHNPLSYNPRFYHQHSVLRLEEILKNRIDLQILYRQADITYDVDFTLLNHLLTQRGFEKLFIHSQTRALLEMGIMELLELFKQHKGEHFFYEIQKVKTILNTMGERFMGACYKYAQ